MDTEILNRLYGNRATLIELSTTKISGTRINKNGVSYCKTEIKKAISENEKLLKLLNDIEDEITGLVVDDEQKAFLYGLSFGTKMGIRVIARERGEELDG